VIIVFEIALVLQLVSPVCVMLCSAV